MFDGIIGYEDIKKELMQIADMIKNPQKYEAIGAKLTHGLLIYGDPGLGKSLMCRELIKEVGLMTYTIMRNKSAQEFMKEVSDTFEKAKTSTPCIIFLDDLDKFSNSDEHRRSTQEYITVQTCMDAVRDRMVFIIATANDIDMLPDSLIRAGRFDRKIEVESPTEEDAEKIIRYYLSDKKVSDDINYDDLAKMFYCASCAELETILNEASVSAAYAGKVNVEMSDLINAVLKIQYDVSDNTFSSSEEELRSTAYHEAGHAVVSELLIPGSVGLVSIKGNKSKHCGFIHTCKDTDTRRQVIQIALGGKVAVETFIGGDTCASGCQSDLQKAYSECRRAITTSGITGIGMIDIMATSRGLDASDVYIAQVEAVTKAELEHNQFIVRDMLINNRPLVDSVASELINKGTLLFSDMQAIKEKL